MTPFSKTEGDGIVSVWCFSFESRGFGSVSAGVQPVPLQTITNENPAGPSLGTIPQARFLLAMLHMLTLKHGANSLSLLLNSGMLALTQSVLRLIGEARSPTQLFN